MIEDYYIKYKILKNSKPNKLDLKRRVAYWKFIPYGNLWEYIWILVLQIKTKSEWLGVGFNVGKTQSFVIENYIENNWLGLLGLLGGVGLIFSILLFLTFHTYTKLKPIFMCSFIMIYDTLNHLRIIPSI